MLYLRSFYNFFKYSELRIKNYVKNSSVGHQGTRERPGGKYRLNLNIKKAVSH